MTSGSNVPEFCVSIDVERDYRLDGKLTVRGIEEGLPTFLEILESRSIPYDLFVSGEIVDYLPSSLGNDSDVQVSLGCHGLVHPIGLEGYLGSRPSDRVAIEIESATRTISEKFGRSPRFFRAPNFSITSGAIQTLESLKYVCDSSILPGRRVRRWRVFPLLDHRGAPSNPYRPDPHRPTVKGGSSILEVPVTSNPREPGSPLGMGVLHESGSDSVLAAVSQVPSRCVVFLCHTWEMVSWDTSDPVAHWVRTASSPHTRSFEALLDCLDENRFVNMARIVEAETMSTTDDALKRSEQASHKL